MPPVALPGPDHGIDYGQSTVLGEDPPVSGGTPPYVYAWSLPAGAGCQLDSTSAANPVLTADRVGTCDATLSVTDASRCESSAAAAIDVACATDLELVDEVIDSLRKAASLGTVGLEEVTVEPAGQLEIETRVRVEIKEGTRVESGGSLSVVIDPLADCPEEEVR